MKKRNKELLKDFILSYNGSLEELNYDDIYEFLEELHSEGILDEIEYDAYSNLSYTGKCTAEEFDYVKETMKLWDEEEYYRRLEIVNG